MAMINPANQRFEIWNAAIKSDVQQIAPYGN